MKKALFVLSFSTLIGFAFNHRAFGGCEISIPNTLQACFNSQHLSLIVTVSDGFSIVTGVLNNETESDKAYACFTAYNNEAITCPGCPILVIDNVGVSTSGHTTTQTHTSTQSN